MSSSEVSPPSSPLKTDGAVAAGSWHGTRLAERVPALHRALAQHRIDHAFGGAIALSYWTRDARPTSDVDLNVFAPAADAAPALAALPAEVCPARAATAAILRDGQIRLWWDETPIDLFFGASAVHVTAFRNACVVAFAGTQIPVLGPVELATFKAWFDRASDWADIEAMLAAGTLDRAAYEHVVRVGAVRRMVRAPRSRTRGVTRRR